MTKSYCPERADIVWLELNPQIGHEQAGRRPVLVLSPKEYNMKTRLAMVCPITSKAKNYPFEVKIPDGYKVEGVILANHLKSVDWKGRNAKKICSLPMQIVEEVKILLDSILS